MNRLDYAFSTVIALAVMVTAFLVTRFVEWIARRRILKERIATGHSISSSEALRRSKIGEGVLIENLSDALPAKWWYLSTLDASAVAHVNHDEKRGLFSSHVEHGLRVEERAPDVLADVIKANGLLLYPITETDRCTLSALGENKIRLFQYLCSKGSDGRERRDGRKGDAAH